MLAMIEIGQKVQRIVKTAATIDGKRKLVARLDGDGRPETKTVASEVTRITRGTLNGHFCRDSGRKLVVRLRDGDILELRPQGTRQAATALLADIYSWMLRSQSDRERMAKLRERKAKLAEQRAERRLRRPLRA